VVGRAAERWRTALEARAIPASILDRAPASPYGFSVDVFARIADAALDGPLDRSAARAAEVLPDGGDLLDVGCGAGTAGLAVAARPGSVGRVIGVDQGDDLLAAFAARADGLGVSHVEVHGRWPDVAGDVPAADVVVCRHVAYNVPDLAPFLLRLTDHARHRVVLHLSIEHPTSWMAPYWERLHDLRIGPGPTLVDARAVAAEAGIKTQTDTWEEPFDRATCSQEQQRLEMLRRRLCLGEDRDDELRAALADFGIPALRRVATVWWAGTAPKGRD
jgi:SAM-dependent methyltransferase